MRKRVKKWLFNSFGGVFVVVGVAGLFLPLLPATPFLLLAGYFLAQGSPEFHRWLLNHKYLGAPIQDWEQKGIIRHNVKLSATLMLLFSAIIILPNDRIPWAGKLGFSLLAVGVLAFIWTRPSR
jgi:uncharacterized membrane protein YbaN (DUF454 family)